MKTCIRSTKWYVVGKEKTVPYEFDAITDSKKQQQRDNECESLILGLKSWSLKIGRHSFSAKKMFAQHNRLDCVVFFFLSSSR